ncbi:MAG: putative metalloprotease CJM1_0395 family protein [Thalassotalea sp.]
MNITTQSNNLPLATVVNPPTDSLRRENSQREVITQPAPTHPSSAEKGVASEKDKAKNPAQNNEHIDFANIKKQAEIENSTINDQSQGEGQEKESPAEQFSKSTEQGEQEHDPVAEFAEQQEINELAQRDREVRSHELAHAAVGGPHTGPPNYSFTVGPDGKKYATGGEVSVDLSTVSGDPQATITKLQKVHSAALAPANPSVQDTRVASQAARLILQAQSELLAQKLDQPELAGKDDYTAPPNSILDKFEGNTASLESDEYNSSANKSADFDQFINATLSSQAQVNKSRPEEVDARAGRIQSFYKEITQAYDKPSISHFQLTA